MNLYEHVAARIREFRATYGGKGVSQDALAKELVVATNTISRWETGTYKPSLEDLEKLSRFFGKSILDFFPESGKPMDDKVSALLRVASDLSPSDIDELRRYAEFRRARYLYEEVTKPKRGRKPRAASDSQ